MSPRRQVWACGPPVGKRSRGKRYTNSAHSLTRPIYRGLKKYESYISVEKLGSPICLLWLVITYTRSISSAIIRTEGVGSSPTTYIICGRSRTAQAAVLETVFWGFKSLRPHQLSECSRIGRGARLRSGNLEVQVLSFRPSRLARSAQTKPASLATRRS